MNAPHKTPGQKAIQRHRERLSQAGMARFEVKAPVGDKDLIRRVAQALAQSDKADALRSQIETAINPVSDERRGGLVAALLRSPLVGADIDLSREPSKLRKVEF